MSQTVRLKVAMTDPEAIRRACVRLNLEVPVRGKTKFYEPGNIEGWLVKLQGWRYPVAIQSDGGVKFDNHNGHWGDMSKLDELAQYYVVEGARMQAEQSGGVVTEEVCENGDIAVNVEYCYA